MSLSGVTNSALSGMQAQVTRLSATANNIANVDSSNYSRLSTQFSTTPDGGVRADLSQFQQPGADGDGVDTGQEMLELTEASLSFKANAAVFETGADLWQLLATIKRD
ncbi:flagellar basal body protein [Rhizobium lemnae]|uniref:Flagellar basal body rod protein FlgC n=1 Tax=Rhizobium lemnae TaxID=1214924 RepID=A0ABV8E909_9HYPH|nr:flagellar basal body protein [Rhizobium lemnae]MCJ8509064.1 flagellar basal body protein [Rhizobium lemnae]